MNAHQTKKQEESRRDDGNPCAHGSARAGQNMCTSDCHTTYITLYTLHAHHTEREGGSIRSERTEQNGAMVGIGMSSTEPLLFVVWTKRSYLERLSSVHLRQNCSPDRQLPRVLARGWEGAGGSEVRGVHGVDGLGEHFVRTKTLRAIRQDCTRHPLTILALSRISTVATSWLAGTTARIIVRSCSRNLTQKKGRQSRNSANLERNGAGETRLHAPVASAVKPIKPSATNTTASF